MWLNAIEAALAVVGLVGAVTLAMSVFGAAINDDDDDDWHMGRFA